MSDPIPRLNAALRSRYHVERKLGEGGMATVYLADDLRHERKVAIKVLRPELGAVIGAERFLAEIRTTAKLQHPHILPLFDSGEADGLLFYVMPFVEGESLRDRLDREKQLPLDDSIRLGSEVADALEYAHRQGVIHRDIKPENVLLQDGRALVADFGIALAVTAAGGARLTETGLSLGTPAYMSPEQATGDREVDHRTDVYALGCMIYEMLAGRPPHLGPTAQAVLAQVLTTEPELVSVHRSAVTTDLAGVLQQAMSRIPADRFGNAGELRTALLNPSSAVRAAVGPTMKHGRGRSAVLIAAGAIGGLALALLLPDGERAADLAGTHLTLSYPPGVSTRVTDSYQTALAISPDGREVVYVGEGLDRRLYRVRLDAPGGTEPIAGTEGGSTPFFSNDGNWIAFAAGNDLMRVGTRGGDPEPIARVTAFRGGTFSPDDEFVYFAPYLFEGIFRVPAAGGDTVRITQPAHDGLDVMHMWPEVLPNGDLLFTSCCAPLQTMIVPGADPAAGHRPLPLEGGFARYVSSGHLVFMQPNSVLAASFDLESGEVGIPFTVLDDAITGHEMFADLAVSRSGDLAYLAGRSDFERRFSKISFDGTVEPIPAPPGSFAFPIGISRDGRQIVYSSYEESQDIYFYDLERGGRPTRLTTHPSNDYSAIWGPEDGRVTFTSIRNGNQDLYVRPVDLSTDAQPIIEDEQAKWPLSWTSDGGLLLVGVDSPVSGGDVWLYESATQRFEPLFDESFNEWEAIFSPDDRWIAYGRDDFNDQREIWAVSFPDGSPCPISTGGGNWPIWSNDAERLYYLQGQTLMVAEAVNGDICLARPTVALEGLQHIWGLSPDEDFVVTLEGSEPPRLNLILNWAEELRRRAAN